MDQLNNTNKYVEPQKVEHVAPPPVQAAVIRTNPPMNISPPQYNQPPPAPKKRPAWV